MAAKRSRRSSTRSLKARRTIKKRKYGRSATKTQIQTGTGVTTARVGRYRSRRIYNLARALNRVQAEPLFMNDTSSLTGSHQVSSFMLEQKPNPLPAKWTQTIRWRVYLQNAESATGIQGGKCSVFLCRTKKTGASANTLLGAHLTTQFHESILADEMFRSNITVVKQYDFVLKVKEAKAIGGTLKVPFRKSEDWRDASNVTDYFPRGCWCIVVRTADIQSATIGLSVYGMVTTNTITYALE